MNGNARAIGWVTALALLVAAVDQYLKGLVTDALAPDKSHILYPGVLELNYHQNTGAAFSLFHHAPSWILLVLNLLVLGIFLALIRPHLPTRAGRVAGVLVLGGALGNMIDRLRLHYVVDYLDFHVWPVFNFADACVVIGVGVLIVLLLRTERAHPIVPGGASS